MHSLEQDQLLIDKLQSLSVSDPSYWSFKGNAKRLHSHALIQYPAMMVPQMQGILIDTVLSVVPGIQSVFDPFVGSGTVLGESQIRGLKFYGNDINPLAVLTCKVKASPFYDQLLKDKAISLIERIDSDKSQSVDVDFFGINKWFNRQNQIELAIIRRAIRVEPRRWARRIFWLTLSSTVRAVCHSRSSTYKLHMKADKDLAVYQSAITIFKTELQKNIDIIAEQRQLLSEKQLLNKVGFYNRNITVSGINVIKDRHLKHPQFDLLVSSPPYGDNQTTVPYGQYSYLPLRWIDAIDIDSNLDEILFTNQNAIDYHSLGGSLQSSQSKIESLYHLSTTFSSCIEQINKIDSHKVKKIASFFYDLNQSLTTIAQAMKVGGYFIWTVGNRRVANIEIPLDQIMRELLEKKACQFVYRIEREIPSKRMASKNNLVNTITRETILIMRKL